MRESDILEITKKKRKIFRDLNESIVLRNPAPEEAVLHEDLKIEVTGAAPTRIQTYVDRQYADETLPLYVCMHGGGFICGSGDFDDKYCRLTALHVKCRVINIDYKLAPEFRFPYQLTECYETIRWAVRHHEELKIDPDRIMVGGHSAGAGISTGLAAMAADGRDFRLCGQVLDYPPVDFSDAPYWTEVPEGLDVENKDYSEFFNMCYLKNADDRFDPYASTICCRDYSHFAPAIIVLAEHDDLTAPAVRYGELLKAAGVYTEVHVLKDCHHGFMTLPMNGTAEAFDEGWQLRWNFMNRYFNK